MGLARSLPAQSGIPRLDKFQQLPSHLSRLLAHSVALCCLMLWFLQPCHPQPCHSCWQKASAYQQRALITPRSRALAGTKNHARAVSGSSSRGMAAVGEGSRAPAGRWEWPGCILKGRAAWR